MYQKYLTFLEEFIRFKSISTDSAFAKEMKKTANWLQTKFEDKGFDTDVIE